MTVESGADLVQTVGREVAQPFEHSVPGEGADLFAEYLAVPLQPTLSSRKENLEGEDPVHLRSRDWSYGNRRARAIGQIVLQHDRRARLPYLRPAHRIQAYADDISPVDHSPSVSTSTQSG